MKPQPERKGPHPSLIFGSVALVGGIALGFITKGLDPWALGFAVVGVALLIYGSTK